MFAFAISRHFSIFFVSLHLQTFYKINNDFHLKKNVSLICNAREIFGWQPNQMIHKTCIQIDMLRINVCFPFVLPPNDNSSWTQCPCPFYDTFGIAEKKQQAKISFVWRYNDVTARDKCQTCSTMFESFRFSCSLRVFVLREYTKILMFRKRV